MLKMFHFDKLFLAFTKLTKRLRSKESRVHKIWIYEVWKKPSWKVRKTRHQENNPDKPSWGTSFLSRSGNHSSQLPVLYFLICSNWELFHCFLDWLYKKIQPLLSSQCTNSWSLLFQTVLRSESRSEVDQEGKYLAPNSDTTGPWLKAAGWFNP